jgi:predicted branched-subunit amino acid permease
MQSLNLLQQDIGRIDLQRSTLVRPAMPTKEIVVSGSDDGFMARCLPAGRISEFRRGVVASLPTIVGVIPFALVLGAQAAQKGLSAIEVPLMTGLNFAGGSEFAAIQLWTWPPHTLLIVAVTFLVNSRHLLMGAALAEFLEHLTIWEALPALFIMCDESWALGLTDARRRVASYAHPAFSMRYYLGVGISIYVVWVLFTTLGATISPVVGNIEVYGFDMAFPAVFLVLLRGMWRGFRSARP